MSVERCAVFVLGEVGRSPRMNYHALSLAKFCKVDLVGLSGSEPHPKVMENSNIKTHFISEKWWNWIPLHKNKLYFLFLAPLKLLIQSIIIFLTLLSLERPSYLIIQTPPALPTLILAKIICFLRGTRLIIDWHNYGWSILQLSLGRNILTGFIKYVEMYLGRTAHHHFCVSNEMKKDLKNNWSIEATVLYDRPPDIFRDMNPLEKHKIYSKISTVQVDVNEEKTPFTILEEKEQKVKERDDRPGLIISSTSWTKDEDFSILLNAVKILDKKASTTKDFPNLEFIITGKGPEKEKYENEMKIMKLEKSRIQTKWLESEDYPKLLGASDLGICLHFSSSLLDLPMKIVDMFGVGLPVCAIYYKTLPELVEDQKNGILFKNSQELSDIIFDLFKNFPFEKNKLDEMKSNIKEFQKYRWDDEWNKKAFPVFAQN